jgi:hypothetical protein
MIQFSLMSLVWDLLILNKTLISLIIFLSPISAQDCFDLEITEEDFPFSHLADLTIEDSDWNQSTFPYAGGGSHENGANGADFTYKLTLSEPAVIYVTTCDQLTNIDVQIGIYTEDCDSSSWIFFQDDSNSPIIIQMEQISHSHLNVFPDMYPNHFMQICYQRLSGMQGFITLWSMIVVVRLELVVLKLGWGIR